MVKNRTRFAQVIEALVELDPERAAEALEAVETELLLELLIEIATPSDATPTIATVFEKMNLDKVTDIVRAWASLDSAPYLRDIFEHTPTPTLNAIFSSLSERERFTLASHLYAQTIERIRPDLLALPDLAITNIEVSILEPMVYVIKLDIRNSGEASANPFVVELYVDGEEIGMNRTESITPGDMLSFDFEWTPELHGNYTIKAVLDGADEIYETDESNNQRELLFIAKSPAPNYSEYVPIVLLASLGAIAIAFLVKSVLRASPLN